MPYLDINKIKSIKNFRNKPVSVSSVKRACPSCNGVYNVIRSSQLGPGMTNGSSVCSNCGWYPSAYRSTISANTRKKVYEADHFECVYCGSRDNLTLEHIDPHSHGGKAKFDNLLTSCKSCNSKNGNRQRLIPRFGRFRR